MSSSSSFSRILNIFNSRNGRLLVLSTAGLAVGAGVYLFTRRTNTDNAATEATQTGTANSENKSNNDKDEDKDDDEDEDEESEEEGGEDLFVHATGLQEEIRENDQVVFEVKEGKKGLNAVNVRLA